MNNLSPATTVDIVAGFDPEGWPVYRTFAKGDIVLTGHLAWRITGFYADNTAEARPHGLGHTGLVASARLDLAKVTVPEPTHGIRHTTGFVVFA